MFGYYLRLALRSLRRNAALTVLMVAAVAVGIGASMTTLTVYRAMSGDPLPQKSRQLYTPQIDNWGPVKPGEQTEDGQGPDGLSDQLSYTDAMALMNAHEAKHQSALYAARLWLQPDDRRQKPSKVPVRAVYTDFFPMFDVPFEFGSPWTALTINAAAVAVITYEMNDRLFGGANSVGRTVRLGGEIYRVVGVLEHWQPLPHFYDLHHVPFGESDQIFLPFTRAIGRQMTATGSTSCKSTTDTNFGNHVSRTVFGCNSGGTSHRGGCTEVSDVRTAMPPTAASRPIPLAGAHAIARRDAMAPLSTCGAQRGEHPAAGFVRLSAGMPAQRDGIDARQDPGPCRRYGSTTRAGASRGAIFAQCLTETAVVGLTGGVFGLALTGLGLLAA